MNVHIGPIAQATDDLVEEFARLMTQLGARGAPPGRMELDALLAWPASTLLAAREGDAAGRLLGIATLALVKSPAGVHARLEDLVVDQAARGRGIGEALTREVLARAKAAGARYLALTSNPRREAANRLYLRLGFQPWETNLYRIDLD